MIYMVECAFTDAAREAAWNAWYDSEKLPALLTVPGFRASQRFRAITETSAPYLAIHSLREAAVLEQAAYRGIGGGTFGGWDDLVSNWRRNLFAGMEAAPEVSPAQCLVLTDDPAAADAIPEAEFAWLEIAGLDRTTERRGLAVADSAAGARMAREAADILRVFAPITVRLVSPRGLGD